METKIKSVLWFALSFVLSFGSYLMLHIIYDWNGSYGFIPASLATLVYIVICPVLYMSFKSKSIWLARGFIWGLVAIIIFLFTIGGCGLVRA